MFKAFTNRQNIQKFCMYLKRIFKIHLDFPESPIVHQIINHQLVGECGVQRSPETLNCLEFEISNDTSKLNKRDAFSIAGNQTNSSSSETCKKSLNSKHKTKFQIECLTKYPWL